MLRMHMPTVLNRNPTITTITTTHKGRGDLGLADLSLV